MKYRILVINRKGDRCRIWTDYFRHHPRENNKIYYYYHRIDGPAVEYNNGSVEYWLNDYSCSKEEFDEIQSRN